MSSNILNCPAGTISYTIVAGDTLYSIAIRYNTTVSAIQAANPNINPNFLQIGQVICVPSQQPTPPCTGTLYTIRAGDTFYAIAIRNNITVDALIAANPGVNPNALMIGQVICIPGTTPPPGTCLEGTFAYQVRAGDTLYALAIRYDTTVNAILVANPNVDLSFLRVGQIICIPERPMGICPPNTFIYTIRAGDNFYQLAIRYNTTVSAIQAANPGVNPNALQIGQRICIPSTPTGTCPPNTFIYTIRAGDNFYQLAIRYNTTVSAIRAANPGVNPNTLQIGQTICIPR